MADQRGDAGFLTRRRQRTILSCHQPVTTAYSGLMYWTDHFTASNSTSKNKVALDGMPRPAPRAP